MADHRLTTGHIFMVSVVWLVLGSGVGYLGALAYGINEFGSLGVIFWGVTLGVIGATVHAVVIRRRRTRERQRYE
jgi:hypothetical protein